MKRSGRAREGSDSSVWEPARSADVETTWGLMVRRGQRTMMCECLSQERVWTRQCRMSRSMTVVAAGGWVEHERNTLWSYLHLAFLSSISHFALHIKPYPLCCSTSVN